MKKLQCHCFFRLTESNEINREKEERLTQLGGVLKNLENKVPTKESSSAIKQKEAEVDILASIGALF